MKEYKNIAVLPRLHREFLSGIAMENGARVLDPCMQNEQAFSVNPAYFWDKAHALQCLNDFQQSTRELARDKNGERLDLLHYQEQIPLNHDFQLSQDELTALQEFAGQQVQNGNEAEENILELAQRMLILAYHNEALSLELDKVQDMFQKQQENLQALLDDSLDDNSEKQTAGLKTFQGDMLLPWQQVFSACMAYIQDADAYYINDRDMAEWIAGKAVWQNEEKEYFLYAVEKAQIMSVILPKFHSCCTKDEYIFMIGKE